MSLTRTKRKTPYDELPAPWEYSGDVNLEYGGTFFKLDTKEWRWGYVSAIHITDLDSACGATGMVMIERITINGTDDRKRIKSGLECCVHKIGNELHFNRIGVMMRIAGGLLSYGYYDPDGYDTPDIIQTDFDAPMVDDGWKATKRIACADLVGYVLAKYID